MVPAGGKDRSMLILELPGSLYGQRRCLRQVHGLLRSGNHKVRPELATGPADNRRIPARPHGWSSAQPVPARIHHLESLVRHMGRCLVVRNVLVRMKVEASKIPLRLFGGKDFGAEGGYRTHTGGDPDRILSPALLPFSLL